VGIQVLLAMSFKGAQDSEGRYPFNPAALLILSEILKFCMSMTFFYMIVPPTAGGGSQLSAAWAQFRAEAFTSLGGSLPMHAAGLSLLYCANNNLTFLLFRWADGGNINIIKAGSTFVSAIILWQMLGRRVSGVQWSAIAIQTAALVITQFGAKCSESNTPILPPLTYLGLFLSVTITSCSSVWNEKVLKDSGRESVSLHTVNAVLYAFGALFNLVVHLLTGGGLGVKFFMGMGAPASLLVLLCNALIGLAVNAVYKYADAVIKSFASACSTAVLFILGSMFFHVTVNLVVMAGCLCIFVATHLYSTNPANQTSSSESTPPPPLPAVKDEGGSRSDISAAPGSSTQPAPAATHFCAAAFAPQTSRDWITLLLCFLLLVVVFIEPYLLAHGIGGRRSLSALYALASGSRSKCPPQGSIEESWVAFLANSRETCVFL